MKNTFYGAKNCVSTRVVTEIAFLQVSSREGTESHQFSNNMASVHSFKSPIQEIRNRFTQGQRPQLP